MFHIPTWPGASRRVPTPTRDQLEPVAHVMAAWLGRIWRAMCEHAQRPGRQVPYY